MRDRVSVGGGGAARRRSSRERRGGRAPLRAGVRARACAPLGVVGGVGATSARQRAAPLRGGDARLGPGARGQGGSGPGGRGVGAVAPAQAVVGRRPPGAPLHAVPVHLSLSLRPTRWRYWGLDSISLARRAARASLWRNVSEVPFSSGTLGSGRNKIIVTRSEGLKIIVSVMSSRRGSSDVGHSSSLRLCTASTASSHCGPSITMRIMPLEHQDNPRTVLAANPQRAYLPAGVLLPLLTPLTGGDIPAGPEVPLDAFLPPEPGCCCCFSISKQKASTLPVVRLS
ncbi:hypothetical protein EYF80_053855 [Liparis tanakae]|uniref:Uncharacterized protein n=1 Tax=Liparis tanakae TaxID=230148 RepID=A0A4Z2F4F1_9TELE|nr:hypothetical protein EYF80_053855 [Liparis tanakae]